MRRLSVDPGAPHRPLALNLPAPLVARWSPRRGPFRLAGRVVWIVAATAALVLSTPAARAQETIESSQRQLRSLKSEIEANRREIDRLKVKERDLGKLAERLRKDSELTRRYLDELKAQETTLRSDLADRQVDLFDKELAAENASARLRRSLLRYYKIREVAGAELLFSSRSFGELFSRASFLARLIHRERIELAALAEERVRIAEAATSLEQRRRHVEDLALEKKREEERLRRQGAHAQAKMAQARDERGERERRIRELEASQTAIRKMIERLEKERARSQARGDRPAFEGTLQSQKRRLAWPVEGRVIAEFGVEVNPRYGTRVPSNGIAIAAAEGTPIRAVAPGLVEFVDWLPGYGRTVIVNHGSGFYTLYAHASSVDVRRGVRVEAGDVIARVGDTDSMKGSCLHFEVRSGEKALNPREWLR